MRVSHLKKKASIQKYFKKEIGGRGMGEGVANNKQMSWDRSSQDPKKRDAK